MANFKDITGQRFGRLTTIGYKIITFPSGQKNSRWFCKCDCGNTTEVGISNLRSGSVQSCGCKLVEHLQQLGKLRRRCSTLELSRIYTYYIRNAKTRKIIWSLNPDQFEKIIRNPCYYCGNPNSKGLDRVKSTSGYTIKNVVPCCIVCNQAKNDRSVSDFAIWVERIYTHLQTKKWSK